MNSSLKWNLFVVNKLYQLYTWSKASEFNPILYKIVDGAFNRQVNGGGRITDVRYFVRNRDIPEVDKFMCWIE